MQISAQDFTVVIQGPIIGKATDDYDKQLTRQCIKSVRDVLPGAEIVISTWQGAEVEHLDFDKVVFSEDPGATTYNDHQRNIFNNSNRQIVTTRNGFKLATRKFAIKMRGDFKLENNNFMSLIGKFPATNKYHLFKHKVIVSTYHSRDPEKVTYLYQVSDMFQIGYTEDMLDLWDIPLQPEPETTRAYPYEKQFWNDPSRYDQYKMRFSSEQYVWFAFAKKKGLDLSLRYFCEMPLKKIGPALQSVIGNFVIVEPGQIGISFPDRLKYHSDHQLYTFKKWERLYQGLCVEKSTTVLWAHVGLIYLNSVKTILINIKEQANKAFFIPLGKKLRPIEQLYYRVKNVAKRTFKK